MVSSRRSTAVVIALALTMLGATVATTRLVASSLEAPREVPRQLPAAAAPMAPIHTVPQPREPAEPEGPPVTRAEPAGTHRPAPPGTGRPRAAALAPAPAVRAIPPARGARHAGGHASGWAARVPGAWARPHRPVRPVAWLPSFWQRSWERAGSRARFERLRARVCRAADCLVRKRTAPYWKRRWWPAAQPSPGTPGPGGAAGTGEARRAGRPGALP